VTDIGVTTATYCYDNADRLTSTTPAGVAGTVGYDVHSNTTGVFGESHTYDVTDRHLTTVKGTTTVTYVRDALDRIVERQVNGTAVAPYSYADSSDSPVATRTTTGAVIEASWGLPGGGLLTTRAAGNVWSYPNLHGDHVATCNQAGVKQGGTTGYDPYGNPIAGAVPDNSAGSMDYGWLGQNKRPLEQQATVSPMIEMGARQYSLTLGRFLETDPVEGGSANDYDYVEGDPVNGRDLDGNMMDAGGGGGRRVNATPNTDSGCGWRSPWNCIRPLAGPTITVLRAGWFG
jgi:RHS repeat-associated protein